MSSLYYIMEANAMKGFLTYFILWDLSKKSMNGAEITKALEKRKGTKPSPGTIYPALKELRKKGFIEADDNKVYSLTKKCKEELSSACKIFCQIFYDMKEMANCCGSGGCCK